MPLSWMMKCFGVGLCWHAVLKFRAEMIYMYIYTYIYMYIGGDVFQRRRGVDKYPLKRVGKR